MGKQTYTVCFCFWQRFQVAVSEPPEAIKSLFNYYSENGTMTVDHLHRFMVEVQKESKATKEDAQAIIDSIHNQLKHLNTCDRKGLNLESLFKYLFSDINPPLSPSRGVHHDMTAPLSHYFIYTGHNSYLTGNQLNSDCSDVPIKDALVERGLRGIELDVWPNSKKDNVEVRHGGTLTPPVELITCLKTIKEYAFVASHYPVVITLEDHLTPDLQAKVAEMVTQTFGEILFSPGPECLIEFPSPESLKKRIIISTKPPKSRLQDEVNKENKSQKKLDKSTPCHLYSQKIMKMLKHTLQKVSGNGVMHPEYLGLSASAEAAAWGEEVPNIEGFTSTTTTSIDDKDDIDEEDFGKTQHHIVAAPEYRHLIAIHSGKPKGGLRGCLKVDIDKVRRVSLSELKLEKAVVKYGKDIVKFTQKNILRVYPKGMRLNSSNYNPLIAWTHGAQMVAFNMQGFGRPLWLMHGMFRANGGCGYVKKPEFLLNKNCPEEEVFDPKVKLPVKTTLNVTLYVGEGWYNDFKHTHFDACSPPDFYAKVGIAGVPGDTLMRKTEILADNWIPAWNKEFEFPLTVPELALLRIEVHEYDMPQKDDFGGQTCLPVSELRQGIRAVPLHDRQGNKYKSVKLLMCFQFI